MGTGAADIEPPKAPLNGAAPKEKRNLCLEWALLIATFPAVKLVERLYCNSSASNPGPALLLLIGITFLTLPLTGWIVLPLAFIGWVVSVIRGNSIGEPCE